MTDLSISLTNDGFDISLKGRDLAQDEGLKNAILISLFTDARANSDDKLPTQTNDLRGWWGDAFASEINGVARPIGSKLWLLKRSKITSETILKVQDYGNEALKWLVSDGIAKAVNCQAIRQGQSQINIEIQITRPDGKIIKFERLWDSVNGLE